MKTQISLTSFLADYLLLFETRLEDKTSLSCITLVNAQSVAFSRREENCTSITREKKKENGNDCDNESGNNLKTQKEHPLHLLDD